MPLITMKTGISTPDGREEVLSEYICDWPDCPNAATQVLGSSRELRLAAAVCDAHAAAMNSPDTTKVRSPRNASH
jgi:hypothetical protein